MLRRIFRTVAIVLPLLLSWPCLVRAQGVRNAVFFASYQQTSATMTFCKVTGVGGDPFGAAINANTPLITAGSSTTVTDPNTLGVFANLLVNDIILVKNGDSGAWSGAVITAKASANSITIDRAQNWNNGGSGSFFSYYHQTCGTTVNDGWINVAGMQNKTLVFSLDVVNSASTGVNVRWQCRASAPGTQSGFFLSTPVQVFPATGVQTYTTVGVDAGATGLAVYETWDSCRVGTAVNAAGNYQVSAYFIASTVAAK